VLLVDTIILKRILLTKLEQQIYAYMLLLDALVVLVSKAQSLTVKLMP